MGKLRVLVVEDSSTVRAHLRAVLSADPGIEVIAETGDGKHATELCRDLRPDVITLDMILPTMTGLAATEHIMAYCPTPILIVSSSFNRGEMFQTYEALAAGAVDVLEKPRGDESDVDWGQKLVAAVKIVARIRVITHPRARLAHVHRGMAAPVGAPRSERPPAAAARSAPNATSRCELVALGASTGGPGAIVEVLRVLQGDFTPPVLLVLHIGEPFGRSFAEWLEGQIHRPVAYAVDGQLLSTLTGRIAMAPPDYHLRVVGGRLKLDEGPERHSCRPSVDVLFESLSREPQPERVAACLLTGMGRDGAQGLLELRRLGALTIAQDEASSVVYGMPREAALLGAAERILPLAQIGAALNLLARRPT
jgi:two-component system chemotaxis response regulator CheB